MWKNLDMSEKMLFYAIPGSLITGTHGMSAEFFEKGTPVAAG